MEKINSAQLETILKMLFALTPGDPNIKLGLEFLKSNSKLSIDLARMNLIWYLEKHPNCTIKMTIDNIIQNIDENGNEIGKPIINNEKNITLNNENRIRWGDMSDDEDD